MVKAHFCDEGEVGGGGEGLEVVDGVVAGLGKPDAGVDAVLEVLGAGESYGGWGGFGLGSYGEDWEKGSKEKQSEATMWISHRRSVIPGLLGGQSVAALRYSEVCAAQNMQQNCGRQGRGRRVRAMRRVRRARCGRCSTESRRATIC
jgi:hypothetical protein